MARLNLRHPGGANDTGQHGGANPRIPDNALSEKAFTEAATGPETPAAYGRRDLASASHRVDGGQDKGAGHLSRASGPANPPEPFASVRVWLGGMRQHLMFGKLKSAMRRLKLGAFVIGADCV
jgi:hypothetical protein